MDNTENKPPAWSEELRRRTRDALNSLNPEIFTLSGRAHLKHISREGMAGYGFIRIDDALRSKWIAEDRLGNRHRYRSVEELIEAGWALD